MYYLVSSWNTFYSDSPNNQNSSNVINYLTSFISDYLLPIEIFFYIQEKTIEKLLKTTKL